MNLEMRTTDDFITSKSSCRHFGSETLFENIHLEIATKSRIALVGRNGAGKSTF